MKWPVVSGAEMFAPGPKIAAFARAGAAGAGAAKFNEKTEENSFAVLFGLILKKRIHNHRQICGMSG
ncbi:hypothetical protein GCM10007416_32720 [Kroppenstedtia guangzhouensis]|uniref:Uncharacterized protein n=1 Tax=Kroppenstedtia guangzhouensis TaxID=1274356 RepID=A0ABQ1H337_9BACL|nr:hypothetical protein GCM10007416_32720 [Kroppenstedtia guangzhouensis]